MKSVHQLFLVTLGLVCMLVTNALAQSPPLSRPGDNIGSWSWDKPSPKKVEEEEESTEREPGETSWERLQAEQDEQEPEAPAPQQKEVLKSLSPTALWRWWRGEKNGETAGSTETAALPDSATTEEPATEKAAPDEPETEEE